MASRGSFNVCILGAGVVGLSTALELQKEFPNVNFSIIANRFNRDTTSDGAAGLFYPSSSFSGPTLEITKRWMADSYEYYDKLRICAEGEHSGVFQLTGYHLSDTSPSLVRNHYMEEIAPVHRYATEEELKLCKGNWKYGTYCVTLGIECRQYLPWAMLRFQERGGNVMSKTVESFGELADDYDVIVNCLGLGAKQLCHDYQLVPIRGQVIKVQAPWVKHYFFGNCESYIIPSGRGRVTLGGCRNYDNYDLKVRAQDTDMIKENCYAMIPKLASAPELETWVGLRPHRQPVRVEAENIYLPNKRGENLKVVHNYGHGGYGVTTAPGTAKYAVDLFRQVHAGKRSQHSKL